MKERLLQLLDLEQLTPSKFADMIGVQRSSISHVLSGRNKPSFDFLQKTLKAFPGLSAEWLVMGTGKMYAHMGQPVRTSLFDEQSEWTGAEEESAAREFVDQQDERHPESRSSADQEPPARENQAHRSTEDVSGDERGKPEEKTEVKTRTETGKQVVRVMVFYEDDTFKSFEPSQ